MQKFDSNAKNGKITVCDICGVIISFPFDSNCFKKTEQHFHDVCVEHKQLAMTFLIEPISEMLNYETTSVENKKCGICNNDLTYKEIHDCLRANSFNYLCEEHIGDNKSNLILFKP